jgi:hypothetical protein
MAENKKSVLVYADWLDKFEELEDDEAGRLIKHFFRYVNDLKPEYPDRITKLSFIDIEKSLKRDLQKWNVKLEGRSLAGKASAEARRLKKITEQSLTNATNVEFVSSNSTNVEFVENNPTNPTDSVNVNVNVNVNDIKEVERENKKDFEKPKSTPPNFAKEKRLLEAKANFKNEIRTYAQKYSKEILNAFFNYWTEPNPSKTKMRYELQKTFDINLRLSNWASKENTFGGSTPATNKKLML